MAKNIICFGIEDAIQTSSSTAQLRQGIVFEPASSLSAYMVHSMF